MFYLTLKNRFIQTISPHSSEKRKCIKVKFQFSEFISGLEKGKAPPGKQYHKWSHMRIKIMQPRFRQFTRGKYIRFLISLNWISWSFKISVFSSVPSQVFFAVPCLARWNQTKSVGTSGYPSLVWKTVPDTISRISIAMLDIAQQCL